MTETNPFAPPAAEPTLDDVLLLGADEVLSWVGKDKKKAREALGAERASDKPRQDLVSKLEKLAK